MRRIDELETWLLLDESDRPEVWTHWGNRPRRVRFRAETVRIAWKREDLGEWSIWLVWTHGRRIHAQTDSYISATFTEHGREKLPVPEWLAPLVAMTNPNQPVGAIA